MSSDKNSFLKIAVDHRQVNHDGTLYNFNDSEAAAFAILLRAWESGVPAVRGSAILHKLGLTSLMRLKQVFIHRRPKPQKSRLNDAWGSLIIATPEHPGFYQLSLSPGTVTSRVTEDDLTPPRPPAVWTQKRRRKRPSPTYFSRNGSK